MQKEFLDVVVVERISRLVESGNGRIQDVLKMLKWFFFVMPSDYIYKKRIQVFILDSSQTPNVVVYLFCGGWNIYLYILMSGMLWCDFELK